MEKNELSVMECVNFLEDLITGKREPEPIKEKKMPETIEEAEAVLLSRLLWCNEKETVRIMSCFGDATGKNVFCNPSNQIIFDAIRETLKSLLESGRPYSIDPIILSDCLERKEKLQEVGGRSYIAHLLDFDPNDASIDASIRIIKMGIERRKTRKERLEALQDGVKNAGPLLVNNILCLLHSDFHKNVLLKIKDDEKRGIATETSDVFIDFILDRLAAISLASPATQDVTESECRNLVSSCNRKDEDSGESDIPSGEF